MTVLTKPSAIVRKPEISNTLLVEKDACDEEKIEIHGAEIPKRSSRGVVCMSVTAILLAILGFSSGLILCRQMLNTNIRRHPGWCSIVVPNDIRELENNDNNMLEPDFRVLPLQWSHNVHVISSADEASSDELVNILREELKIGNTVEKISVVNNGHQVDFIHDFNDNTTSIIDDERCFVMELEPEVVLSPDAFLSGLQGGRAFDVSRVRSQLRAALPALPPLPALPAPRALELATRCFSRPIYRLYSDDGLIVHKRAADAGAAGAAGAAAAGGEYVHFAGRHVQEIRIANLPELLRHENELRTNTRYVSFRQ